MARSKSREDDLEKKAHSFAAKWAKLTWDDLERWAGSPTVTRGRSYQRGGQVKDLKITSDGDLLATVVGGNRYATTVELTLSPKRKHPTLASSCSCPVGISCKHAVATVAEYLQAVANGRELSIATEDDPRWVTLDEADYADEEDDDEDWEDEDDEEFPIKKIPSAKRPARRDGTAASWDDKIEQHLRAKSRSELADLVWSLTRRFPEIYQEFRERIALQEGDVEQLLEEARHEIQQVTSEPAWRNRWNGEEQVPDFSRIQHRFERLLELGHADAIVSLGRELIEQGLQLVGESDDEGETAIAFARCLPIVFQALACSSLSGPERILFAIDAELQDKYDALDDTTDAILNGSAKPEDWSVVADTLAKRKDGMNAEDDKFSSQYQRDRVTDWIARALREAGRDGDVRTLYESEAEVTGSYRRLVDYLLETRCFVDAERWAKTGIAATRDKYPGTAKHLAASLCELARTRKQWDLVAAHAARSFFEAPSPAKFDELVKAASKAKAKESVRATALRFLETGVLPFQMIFPPPAKITPPTPKSQSAKTKSRPPALSPEPKAAAPGRLKLDPAWPLPMPEYLIPRLNRPGRHDSAPRPRLEVLLEMAIAAKRPEEVLRWFDKMRSEPQQPGLYIRTLTYADRVAAAVAATHPERSIEIYQAAIKVQLPNAQQSAYETVVGYLKKLRPIYEALGRKSEWTAQIASIREQYRNRPRFMELLDRLDGRTIAQSIRPKRK
ncbi:Uncharacterized conserved protein, contains Zn finger domain [Singulisphaera sp. GP187]|uniref:SWIM zinc finger family protein n=1 Tax=Singulisphaera sp. GP187 TaxID=1882752 RepID=UPI00092C6E66|nr:hypothetical protein [Singulisphaera sp. GP187]SIO38298.1 Uncharacterized conserved protein, contains Zn finger domain [Singulisphaera sp. GP187]